jgi:mono/diheme cytochrome c family protein
LVIVLFGTVGFFVYFGMILPRDIPVQDIQAPADSAAVERGRYLANHVAVCMDCHSTRDWSYFSGPLAPGTLGKGGERFDESTGLPGVVVSKNITPAAIGDWSDGELHRAITGGLRPNGSALFPLMPYDAYRFMPEQDVLAIIAYLRTLEPIANDVPDQRLNFPLNLIVNSIPKPAEPRAVNRADPVDYGRYLATIGGCIWCHTPVDDTQRSVPELMLAGGHEFPMPGFVVSAANITPDRETGIGGWSRDDFIARFRRYQGPGGLIPVRSGDLNSLMSWTRYADMTDDDLSAIYTFLMQAAPIANRVEIYRRDADGGG